MRVIFLDVDGPMIPGRQYRSKLGTRRYDRSGDAVGYLFDPFCVRLITQLCRRTEARIVWNTTHNDRGLNALKDDMRASGMDFELLHDDPQTEYPGVRPLAWSNVIGGISRLTAITRWLAKHEHTIHWCAIDDEKIRTKRLVHVDFEGGITTKHTNLAMDLLAYDGERISS